AAARVSLQLTFVAYQAFQMIHAIGVTIVRIAVTHRKMLEWQTAAATARAHGSSSRSSRLFIEEMVGSPLFALLALGLVSVRRPQALPAALPLLALWMAAPVLAYILSQPFRRLRREIKGFDRRLLRLTARRTWRFFDTFVTAAEHGLPPDNFQASPAAV